MAFSTKNPDAKPAAASSEVATKPANAVALHDSELTGQAGNVTAALSVGSEFQSNALPFHYIRQKGGPTGGGLEVADKMPREIANQLPQGKQDLVGVFIAYRIEMTAWPVSYDEKTDDTKPAWNVAVPCTDADGARLLGSAAEAYQYTKNIEKRGIWNRRDGELVPGHIRPLVAILVYVPKIDDFVVVQTCPHFSSWRGTMDNIKKLADATTGILSQKPVTVSALPQVKNLPTGGEVPEHTLVFRDDATETGLANWKAWQNFRARLLAAPEKLAVVQSWIAATDRPLTPEVTAELEHAATLKPKRK